MRVRLAILIAIVAAAGALNLRARPTPVHEAAALESLPLAIGSWQGSRGADFTPRVLAALGVDDHLNRSYRSSGGRQANVYVGYYRSQQQGASIHSPLNCMPGAGWEAEEVHRVPFAGGAARLVRIRKGDRRLMVLYWYQTATRVEGDEYRGRLYTVLDTIRHGRNDAALVRVIVPIADGADGETAAMRTAAEFAGALQPHVLRVLFPSASASGLAAARLSP